MQGLLTDDGSMLPSVARVALFAQDGQGKQRSSSSYHCRLARVMFRLLHPSTVVHIIALLVKCTSSRSPQRWVIFLEFLNEQCTDYSVIDVTVSMKVVQKRAFALSKAREETFQAHESSCGKEFNISTRYMADHRSITGSNRVESTCGPRDSDEHSPQSNWIEKLSMSMPGKRAAVW
jgi:hypothetical protein